MHTEDQIKDALRKVEDPEIGMDIITLELVRKVEFVGEGVKVVMTLTSPMCPFGPYIIDETKKAVQTLGIKEVEIELSFNPSWEPSQELRALMGI